MFNGTSIINSATNQILINYCHGVRGYNINEKDNEGSPYPKWKKIGSRIFFIFLILYSLFGIKACSDIKEVRYNDISIEYTVTGYKEYQRKHKSHYHTERYIFVHNDKLGDYTFTVSPKTYYDAEHGKNKMIFSDAYYDLLYKADNIYSLEQLKSNYKMFGLTEYQINNFKNLDIFCVFGMTFGFLILFIIYYWVFDNDRLAIISVIIWIISLLIMFLITCF